MIFETAKFRSFLIILGMILALLLGGEDSWAGVCAKVKIEILQDMTFERVAFDARLVVTNSLPSVPGEDNALRHFNITVAIRDSEDNPLTTSSINASSAWTT